jgi:hypothetical protein
MKKINLEKMTDVCVGKMNIKKVVREIEHYFINYSPKRMIVDIKFKENKNPKGYYTSIYIPIKDFKKKK